MPDAAEGALGEPMYPCIEPHADAPLCGHGELPPERVIAWNLAIIAGNLDRIATVLEREAMNRAGL